MTEEFDSNRTIIFQNSDGSYERVSLNDYKDNPVIHKKIRKNLIKKIDGIYYSMMGLTKNLDMNLEQFEIMFMKEYDILNCVKKWDIISKIFNEYIEKFNINEKEKALFVIFVAFLVVYDYDFTEENKKKEVVQRIIELYNSKNIK